MVNTGSKLLKLLKQPYVVVAIIWFRFCKSLMEGTLSRRKSWRGLVFLIPLALPVSYGNGFPGSEVCREIIVFQELSVGNPHISSLFGGVVRKQGCSRDKSEPETILQLSRNIEFRVPCLSERSLNLSP